MKSNNLHSLIKSLTKSEKRFITLNTQIHKGDKVYLKLLEAIDKQDVYDEKLILRQFKNEAFVNQFSVAKNYLQSFILKQLRHFHSNLKASIECKNYLIEVEILFWKGQYRLAEKHILKTEKLAKKYEFFLILEDLNNWRGRIYNAQLKLDTDHKITFEDQSKTNIEMYQNILDYKELTNTTQLLIKKSEIIRDSKEQLVYDKLLKNPLLVNANNAKSNQAKYGYYVLNSVIKRMVGELDESERYRKDLLTFLESKPYLIQENPIHYIAAIHNILMNCLVIKDYELYEKTIKKLKNYDFKMPHEKAYVFSTLCLFELGYYTERKEYDKAIKFVEETIANYSELNGLLNMEHEFLLHYNAGLAQYHRGEYNQALKWINKVINLTSKDLRVDVKASAYVLNILIHYDLENYELLPYVLKSTTAFLKQNKMFRKIDQAFLSIFSNIPLKSDKKETIKYLKSKLDEMNKVKEKDTIISDINYFEWIKNRIG
ncbi:MAG: hypothetical protein AB7O47_07605 [Flavobacteriales bacterium]